MRTDLRVYLGEYSNAFTDCHTWYQDYLHGKNPDINCGYKSIESLKKTYVVFVHHLRDELDERFYWNQRGPELTSQVKILFPIIFESSYLKKNTASIISEAQKMAKSPDDAVLLASLIRIMADSLKWYSGKSINRSHLERFRKAPREYPESSYLEIPDNKAISANGEPQDKLSIPRDAIWFLFCALRQRGIIKQMPDTELSEIVSNLSAAEYSAGKLRQSKLRTNQAKEKLTQLLKHIMDEIEG